MTPDHAHYSDNEIARVLSQARTFALIGASANPTRPSYFVMKYLLSKGYQVVPINPGLAGQEILGQPVYGTLDQVSGPVDVVDIFRNSDAALGVTQDAIRLREVLSIRVVWMQLGVQNIQAAHQAEAAGLKVIMNRCPKIEYGRLSGEIGWVGVNSGTLSSKRPRLAPQGVQDHRLRDE